MKKLKVVDIFYIEELHEKNQFMTGIVYELEDGNYLAACQDGYVTPLSELKSEEIAEIFY